VSIFNGSAATNEGAPLVAAQICTDCGDLRPFVADADSSLFARLVHARWINDGEQTPQACECGSHHLALVEQLADCVAKGRLSYRAVGRGTFQMRMSSRNRGATSHDIEAAPATSLSSRRNPGRGYWSHMKRIAATKIATMEAIVCVDCSAISFQVQDPEFVELGSMDGYTHRLEDCHSVCRRCETRYLGWLPSLPDTIGEETQLAAQPLGMIRGSRQLVGVIGAFVCTKCGLLEPTVCEPDTIPFEQLEGFRWCESRSPYRG
jgi:hypothetical protein